MGDHGSGIPPGISLLRWEGDGVQGLQPTTASAQAASPPPYPRLFTTSNTMKEKGFGPSDVPRWYLTAKVVGDENAIGGGYQK